MSQVAHGLAASIPGSRKHLFYNNLLSSSHYFLVFLKCMFFLLFIFSFSVLFSVIFPQICLFSSYCHTFLDFRVNRGEMYKAFLEHQYFGVWYLALLT